MDAILISRASTEDQLISLPAQSYRVQDYANKQNYGVIQHIQYTESAYKPNRKIFHNIVRDVKKTRHKVVIVCDKVDRLTRCWSHDLVDLFALYEAGRVNLDFPNDRIFLNENSSAMEKAWFRDSVNRAISYSEAISENVRRSFEEMTRQGKAFKHFNGYQFVPTGEINRRGRPVKTMVEGKNFWKCAETFELYSSGIWTYQSIAKKFRAEGWKTCNKSTIMNIVHNPVYVGYFKSKDGQYYKHNYPTCVTWELYAKCQAIRRYSYRHKNHPYALKGIIKCAVCDTLMSPYFKQNKYGTYYYLQCRKHNVAQKCIFDQLSIIFSQLFIEESEIKDVIAELVKDDQNSYRIIYNQVLKLTREHELNKDEQIKVSRKFSNDLISKENYDGVLTELQKEETIITECLEKLYREAQDVAPTVEKLLRLCNELTDKFQKATPEDQNEFLQIVFRTMQMRGKTLEFTLNEGFEDVFMCSTNNYGSDGWN